MGVDRMKDVSNHIYALAQHIELSQANWWDDALDIFILDVLYRSVDARLRNAVAQQVAREISGDFEIPRIMTRINDLQSGEEVLAAGPDTIVLSESARTRLTAERAASQEIDAKVAQRYRELSASRGHARNDDLSWERFESGLLLPVVQELGARTLHLLSGHSALPETTAFHDFMRELDGVTRDEVQELATQFLDPSEEAIRAYIMGRLNFYLLLSAGSLDRATLERISAHRVAPTFNLVLDTNVVFSLLNLHRNPSNEAVSSLVALTNALHDTVKVNLYVIPPTIEEARSALSGALAMAPRGRVTKVMASVAQSRLEVSGLVEQYFAVAAATGVTPSSYFSPLIEDLESILIDRGIQLLDQDVDMVADRPGYKDDVERWWSFEYDKAEGRSKERIRHDLHLWHFVDYKRPASAVDLMEASWWVLTGDSVFQRRDTEKRQGRLIGPPRTINPADLVQMLRFWVPRSAQVEAALLGSIRFPFSFFRYDRGGQKASLAILDRLSHMSNVEDFDAELTVKLLENQALRSVITSRSPNEEQIQAKLELVVVEELRERTAELEELKRAESDRTAQLRRDQERTARRADVERGMQESKANLLKEQKTLEKTISRERRKFARALEEEKQRRGAQETELADLRTQLDALTKSQVARQARASKIWFAAGVIITIVALAVAFPRIPWALLPEDKRGLWMSLCGIVSGALLLVAWRVLASLVSLPKESLVYTWLHKGAAGIWSWLGAGLVGGVLGAAISSIM